MSDEKNNNNNSEPTIVFIPDTAKEVGDYRRKVIENYPTLRDTFAASALTGILRSNSFEFEEVAAKAAYRFADAMLKERALPIK